MLLTVTGRKSGQPHTSPLLYLKEGDTIVTVASKGGMDHHPVWYLNLKANPDVQVQIGKETRPMRARTATLEEKAAYWPKLVAMYRDYDDYQKRTKREIPVVILTPR
jgi:deazaflavin-dependent oxidoreductase (nitroreductase family)